MRSEWMYNSAYTNCSIDFRLPPSCHKDIWNDNLSSINKYMIWKGGEHGLECQWWVGISIIKHKTEYISCEVFGLSPSLPQDLYPYSAHLLYTHPWSHTACCSLVRDLTFGPHHTWNPLRCYRCGTGVTAERWAAISPTTLARRHRCLRYCCSNSGIATRITYRKFLSS